MKDLTKGKPIKLILQFAIPVMLGNIFQLFYSLADTRIVGSCLGEEALAAVGSTSSLNSMIVGFLLGLTNGFAIISARSFGAKDEKHLKRHYAYGNLGVDSLQFWFVSHKNAHKTYDFRLVMGKRGNFWFDLMNKE